MSDGVEPTRERYTSLCDRAVEFVSAKGGVVPEDMLITHVFGNSGTPNLWRSLLRNVLGDDERLVFRGSGEWALPAEVVEAGSASDVLDEFVALDVETTGLKPTQHRVIEIAIIRYRNGQIEESFDSLINPDRGIPEFITRLTTITNEHVREAPRFADVAERIVEFIGDSLIVGHNVRFDIGFLNAELGRCDIAPVVNERLDTMGLAVRLLKSIRKPSLDRVADAVGLSPRGIHRAGGDAKLTAEVGLRLVAEAARNGVTSLDHLKATGHVETPRVRDDVGRARAVMDRTLAHQMPKRPGCYIMRDARNEIVYIGKAKNLRDRVSSYYSQPIGMTRKMDGLIEAVKQIDHEIVGSELEALLLESQLIRRFQPRYNTALKRSEHYPYIKVDVSNPWPRVSVAKNWADDGARYFGPYRSAASARKTVEVINSVLPLRTCTRSFKNVRSYGKPCIALDLHQCIGPCTGQASQDAYRDMVQTVIRFLDGKDDALHQHLLAELEKAAERLDFEKAERLRKNIRSVTSILEEQNRLRDAEQLHNLLLVLPSSDENSREVLVILRGRLWAQLRAERIRDREGESVDETAFAEDAVIGELIVAMSDLAQRLERSLVRARESAWKPRDHHDVDQANILNRFLFRNDGHPALIQIPVTDDDVPAANPMLLAARALAVSDNVLATLDAPKRPTDAIDDVRVNDVEGPALSDKPAGIELEVFD